MAIVGADVHQLRDLAKLLAQGSDRLDATVRAVSSQLASTRWTGPDSDRSRSEWQSVAVPGIRTAIIGLREAAEALQRNANEQEHASSAGAGTAGGGRTPSSTSGGDVTGILGNLLAFGGIVNDIADAGNKGLTGVAGGVMGVAGVVTSVTTLAEGVTSGDNLQTGDGVIGLVGSGLGKIHPALGAAAGAAQLYGNMTLPTSEADIDGVFDVGAHHMFGKGADELTPEQQVALSHRYDGAWGVATMISDSMDHKANGAVEFFKGLVGR